MANFILRKGKHLKKKKKLDATASEIGPPLFHTWPQQEWSLASDLVLYQLLLRREIDVLHLLNSVLLW
jgi:hypothetical protein